MIRRAVVSVIIPVYNSGKTLRECLLSVLNQSYEALEIIAVNDGSTDNSPQILREFEQKDNRLRVITEQNSGVSAARNRGLSVATGDYLQFADSDDTLPPDSTERLVNAVREQQCDMAIALYNSIWRNTAQVHGFIKENTVFGCNRLLDELTKHPNSFYYSVLWNKLYRRDIVKGSNLRFDESLPWGEDFDFNMRYYSHIASAAMLASPVYNYRRNVSGLAFGSVKLSIMHPIYSIKIKLTLMERYTRLYRDAGLYEQYRTALRRYLFRITIKD